MNSPVDEIKNKLDIVDVIGGYIKLKKAGRDYKAPCPFHNEKTPSFFVSPSKQIWHCFGCNLGGDMFNFVMQMEGVEFVDALRILARRAGITIRRQDPKLKSQRSKFYDICEEAADFFEKNLSKNKQILDYLEERGILIKTIKEFRVGYGIDSWDALYNYLTEVGYDSQNIENIGLIIKKQKYYDRFRKRIMFPINDISGQVVGFTGRIFKEESSAKYINSPESIIFNKSRVLYGLDKARVEIRKADECILVEGQVDVIMSHQAGVKNAVATSGTALTQDHLRIIKRYTDNILLAFDMDIAGETATKKSIGLAQQAEFNVKIIVLSEEKDPADIIKKNPKAWKKAIEQAKPVMEFYFNNAFSKYDVKKVEDKRKIAQELLAPIKRIANEIEKAHWIQPLAYKLNVEEKLLKEALTKIENREQGILSSTFSSIDRASLKKSRLENIEQNLLGLVLKYQEHLELIKSKLKSEDFTNITTRKVFEYIKKQKVKKIDHKKIQEKILLDQPYYIDHIIFQVEHYNLEKKDILKEINFCLNEIKKYHIKQKASEISLAIKKAEQEKNKKQVEKLKKQFNNLVKNNS